MTNKLRKLANRSGKECCTICGEQSILVTHHIGGRKIPKANHKDNLINCCDNCHRKLHSNKLFISGWFMTTDGRQLLWSEIAN
jgi:hypothetical protein